MRTITEALKIETKEEPLEELKEHVKVRDQMGGALYWNILNDECCQIANKLASLGVNRAAIVQILGPGNYS